MTRRRALVILAVAVIAPVAAAAGLLRSCAGASPPAALDRPTDVETARPAAAPPATRRRAVRPSGPAAAAPPAVDPAAAGEPAGAGEPPLTCELVVHVRDPSGRLVPGVDVAVAPRHSFVSNLASGPPLIGDPSSAELPEPSAATTDASGTARLVGAREGPLRVVASAAAWHGETTVAPGRETGHLDVALTVVPAFRLSGRVVHEDGTPIPGATVYVAVPLPGRVRRQPRRLEVVDTDDSGRFTCHPHPVPDTRIIECYVMGKSMAGNAHRFPVRVGVLEDVELVVTRGTVIRGRCVDEDGDPLARVRIRGIRPPTGEITYTGGSGRFALPVPGAGGGLLFFVEGRVQTAVIDLRGPPEGRDIGDVLIPRGGTLAGRVLDEAGGVLARADVVIVEPLSRHAAATLVTDKDGAFRTDLIGAGVHHIQVGAVRPGEPDGVRCWFRFDGFTAGTTDATLIVPAGLWTHVEVHDASTGEPLWFQKGAFTLMRDDGSGLVLSHRAFETEPLAGFHVQLPGPGAYVLELELPVTGTIDRRSILVESDAPPRTIVLTPR